VGASFCDERAWFSNFGDWVTAWAPGVDIVSTFFHHNGPAVPIGGLDPDNYTGWAEWSGTSFAAPQVAGSIAKRMCEFGEDPRTAWAEILEKARPVADLGRVIDV
jgi:subtilisin family serine protease